MPSEHLVGKLVNGKYAVQRVIAAGGMGKIYLAEQQPLGRAVALKVLHPRQAHLVQGGTGSSNDPAFKKRFFREASILARLQHPNIVTVFDYGKIEGLPEEDEQFFMAMEFLQGETLAQRMARVGRLGADEVARMLRQVSRGLAEAHGSGIVHRDLKPSNLMVSTAKDGEEVVKIVDFGIVKLTDEDEATQDLTQEGSFIGSPKYMAPEQIASGKVDARTDIYSLGIILYQALAGRLPFDAETSIQVMMAHVNQAPPPIRERSPEADVPEWLEALVMRCLLKDASLRPQSVEEILRTLAEVMGGPMSSASNASISGLGGAPRVPSLTGMSPSGSAPPGSTGRGPRISSTGVGALGSADTQTSRTPSIHAGPNARRRLPLSLAAVAVLLLGGLGVLAMRSGATVDPTPAAPSSSVASPRVTFALTVDSTPSGAEVSEGSATLGLTPLTIVVDNDAARITPRRLTLRHPGHEPYEITQGSSDQDVRIAASLTAATAASATASPSASTAPSAPLTARPQQHRRPPTGPDKPTSAPVQPDLDIRMKR